MTAKQNKAARGVRNHNPLNIRHGQQWRGLAVEQPDKTFDTFVSDVMGFRAGFCILRTYINKYGLSDIEHIIHRWAPPFENDTYRYVTYVKRRAGIAINYQRLSFTDRGLMCRIVQAMAEMECGKTWPIETIQQAYDAV